ncbi:MAG TPA: hypothetical protein VMJ10_17090 [Kofleriaceae bacterium]|nr:hypothetical protein [Kofleriaceae bacterium]
MRRWLNDSPIQLDKNDESGEVLAFADVIGARILIESRAPRNGEIPPDWRDNHLFLLQKSSGGTLGGLIYRISKMKSRTRTLQPGARR